MANLSICELDDDTIMRLRIRADHHQVLMEEEAITNHLLRFLQLSEMASRSISRILRQAVTAPKRLGDLSVQFFGAKPGVELELPQHAPHDPLSFA